MYPHTATICLLPFRPDNGYTASFIIFSGAVSAGRLAVLKPPRLALSTALLGQQLRAHGAQHPERPACVRSSLTAAPSRHP